ncbi:hypothetical protein J4Q44_G00336700 [Coregonus suidteri]|uniref:Uncharacterized protein n=1 Tax=Coregonus suidteri TaxID=861788 RepID=A0AAN8QN87_9TELE
MLSEVDLAAQHVVIMLALINYMFSLGIQAAACVRVGNALGARDRAGAILTSKVSLALSGSMAVIQGIMLISTKTGIAFMFTSDEQVIDLVPCSSVGLFICVILQSIFFITVIFRLNWKRMTEKAVKRAGKAGHMVSMRSIVAPDHTENNGRTVNGYMSVPGEPQGKQLDPRGAEGGWEPQSIALHHPAGPEERSHCTGCHCHPGCGDQCPSSTASTNQLMEQSEYRLEQHYLYHYLPP